MDRLNGYVMDKYLADLSEEESGHCLLLAEAFKNLLIREDRFKNSLI